MSLLRETAISVPLLAMLLFLSHTFLGTDESQLTVVPTSWLGGVPVPAVRFIAKDPMTGSASGGNVLSAPSEQASARDLSPEARIRSVFAQFVSGGRRPAT